MAKLYGNIAASAKMTFDKSFSRSNGQPLDSTEVYYSLTAAKEYAATATAYVGQKIVVIENNKITHYSIEDTAGNLKELGAKPVGDESSIVVAEDGTISLAGIEELVFERDILGEDDQPTGEKETVKYQPLMTKDGLVWVEPSKTTVEGLATLLGELTARVDTAEDAIEALETAVGVAAKPESTEGAGDGVAATGLFKAIAEEIARATAAEEALGGRIDNIDFVDEDELAEALDPYATKTFVGEEIAKIPVTGVAADDKVLALGADKLISATVALSYDSDAKEIKLTGKDGADLGSVDATPFIKDGMLNNVEYNPENNTLTFTWNTDSGELTTDTVVLSDIIEPYTAGDGLKLVGNEFAVKVAEGNESFLTVNADGVKLSGVQDAIDAAKAGAISDAEGKIATAKDEAAEDAQDKADKALADAKADAAGLYATKEYVGTIPNDTEGNPKAANVVAYIEKKAAEVLSQATGGSSESAASVKAQLDTYKAENDPKVTKNTQDIAAINEKLNGVEADADVNIIEIVKVNGKALTPDENKAVDVTVPTKFSEITDDSGFDNRITEALNQANKGVSDASAAQSTANEAKSAAEYNASVIATINETVAGHTTTIGDHTTKIGLLNDYKTEHDAHHASLDSIVSGHTQSIAGKAEQTALDAAVADIAKNTAAIKTLNETTIVNLTTEVGKKANSADVHTKDEITAIIGTPAEGKTVVKMIEDAQKAATYDDTGVKADIQKNADAIAILNGDDKTEGSVKHEVAQELAKIVNDNNNGSVDTLNEIAAWIVSDQTGAAKMNADIEANKTAIAKLNGDAETAGSVLSMIAANAPKIATKDVSGLVKSVDAVVDGDGKVTNAGAIENKVSVATDGTMSVNSLNVNKLVQTHGDYIIFNGGTAAPTFNTIT